MVTLAITGATGAVEGALYTAYRRAKEPLLQLRVSDRRLIGDVGAELPVWMDRTTAAATPFHLGRELERMMAEVGVTTTVSIGFEGGLFAARHLTDSAFTAVLLRGELNLSHRRPAQRGAFRQIAASARELVLEDHWEMAKAARSGSQVPHLRLPLLRAPGLTVLSSAGARVAVLHPRGSDLAPSLEPGLRAACERQGATLKLLTVDGLYTARDLEAGRTLDRALQNRLSSFTHVVVLGDHRDTVAVVPALAAQPERLVVDGTLASTALARRLDGVECARGTAVIERLEQKLSRWRVERRAPGALALGTLQRVRRRPGVPRAVAGRALAAVDRVSALRTRGASGTISPPAWFSGLAERHLPWFHEELWDADEAADRFDVFFTVASVEDRADGARPQRVRNMAEAMHERGPTVLLLPAHPVLDRRARLLAHLVSSGMRPGLVYGENSTSPMASDDMIDRVGRMFGWLGEHGARRAWYVRDLHWLAEELVSTTPAPRELVDRGLHELRTMAAETELFLAPNQGTEAAWAGLLAAEGLQHRRWGSLPPALHPDNVCTIEGFAAGVPGLTLLYAGGSNAFYRQDIFLGAVAELSKVPGFHLDLVVREAEAADLAESLERAGIVSQDAVRVITEDLSRYVPVTGTVLGVAVLDGTYAAHAFPFKTVSMLERGLHVLCFEDMAVADFLRRYDAGVLCGRDVASVVEHARAYAERHDRIDVPALLRQESWAARVDQVDALLAAGDRPASGADRVRPA